MGLSSNASTRSWDLLSDVTDRAQLPAAEALVVVAPVAEQPEGAAPVIVAPAAVAPVALAPAAALPVPAEAPIPVAADTPPVPQGCSSMSQKIWGAIIFVALALATSLAVWQENQWQHERCGELLTCGMNESSGAGGIFQTSQQFEELLRPSSFLDSNKLRAKLWFGGGRRMSNSLK